VRVVSCKREEFGYGHAMTWIVIRCALLGLLLLTGAASAVENRTLPASKPAVKAEIVTSVEGQLAAFREGEMGKAYAYASTVLQMQTPIRRFVQLVRQGYPEIWSNLRVEFGLVRDDGRRATVTARVFAQDGSSAVYDYVLVKEDDFWRIAGVLRHEAKGETRV
jgi:hypothetical protein